MRVRSMTTRPSGTDFQFAKILVVTLCSAVIATSATAAEHDHAQGKNAHPGREFERPKARPSGLPFGPWQAGEKRAVSRQGEKGLARSQHPSVGEVAKVPGDGPPPPPLRPDPDVPESALIGVNDIRGAGLSSNPLYFASLFYRHMLTKADGPRCAHLPTCSRFASQAVAQHGALGILMGLDRIIRPTESSALRTLPQVEGWGVVRHLDPVSNYEFWKEGRFSGMPADADEEPLTLPKLQANAKQNGDGALPPPAKLEWVVAADIAPGLRMAGTSLRSTSTKSDLPRD